MPLFCILFCSLLYKHKDPVLTGAKKVDVEAVPTISGQSLYEIDLDSADKPWRLPGGLYLELLEYISGIRSHGKNILQ